MLTHLKLNNFKIWRTTGPMRLAPLTLLLGTNSSGKSSLIQSLLLIRQTAKGDDPNLDLNLGNPDAGDTVTLGQFRDLLCRHGIASPSNPANQVGIEFRWQAAASSGDTTLFSARYRKGPAGSAELEYLRLGRDGQGFTVQRRKAGIYRLQLADEKSQVGQSAAYRPQRSFSFSAATIADLGQRGEAVKGIGPSLLDELGRIIYLGPIRRLAQRDYVWAGRMPANIGDDGAKAVDALIASGVALQQAKRRKQPPPPEGRLFTKTVEWLKRMNLADGLLVRPLGTSARYELLVQTEDEHSNIKDVGVGVSQVLPVIVAALFARPWNIVILEEPESHLHPLAQGVLADLMVHEAHERKVQFIVESHSEHLFRRMQTLIARQDVRPGESAMYFVEREGKAAQLLSLEVDQFGRVQNWPEGFFGDALGETREQARLMFERMKEEKG